MHHAPRLSDDEVPGFGPHIRARTCEGNKNCQLCGWARPPLVLLLAAPLNSVNSVAGLCGWALSSCSCPPLGRPGTLSTPWLGSVSRPCPPLVLHLAAPLNSVNSVAGLCAQACSSLVLLLAAPLNSVNSVAGLCGARSDIRPRKARSERALQRERQRKIN